MLFNSFEFFLLLAVTFFLYYAPVFKKHQLLVLIVSSFVFYAFNKPVLLLLLIASILLNAVISYKIMYGESRRRKLWAITGVTANLVLLLFFKYSPLFANLFLTELFHYPSAFDFLISIPLPIGISFFTFQGISLVVDAYKNKEAGSVDEMNINKSPLVHLENIALFKSFFPQLISGPIVKAHYFLPQIERKLFRNIDSKSAFTALVQGYFLKTVIADNIREQTYGMMYPFFLDASTNTLLLMIYGYSMQIFADFAGYSLIAIGLAQLFGYRLPENFNFPYLARSFADFWQRWHMSLSSWLREYLYYPLGGNRKGKWRTYFNLMTVMMLGGLWHGADWSYAVWGGFHGILLATERFLNDTFKFKFQSTFLKIAKALFVFILVTFGWLLFKLPDFHHVIAYMDAILSNGNRNFHWAAPELYIVIYSLPVIAYHLYSLAPERVREVYVHNYYYLYYGVLLFLITVNSGFQGAFIYFKF